MNGASETQKPVSHIQLTLPVAPPWGTVNSEKYSVLSVEAVWSAEAMVCTKRHTASLVKGTELSCSTALLS